VGIKREMLNVLKAMDWFRYSYSKQVAAAMLT